MSVFGYSTLARWGQMLFPLEMRPELKELYIFSLLSSFAFALVAIFEPVFFYQEGFSLSFIALYYGLHYTIYVFVLPLGGMFAARFGVERGIALSLPFFVLYFLTLAAIPYNHDFVYLAIVLLTAHKVLYWPSFHADLAKFGDKKNRGTELSWMSLLKNGVGILGPLIGGFVAAIFGFPVLFMAVAGVLLLSAIPILRTRENYHARQISYTAPWQLIRQRKHRHMVLGMVGWGENLVDLVFWPIFMFIILGSTEVLGVVASITVAIMTVFGFFIGEMADRYPRRWLIRLHIPFMFVGHLLRPLSGGVLRLFLTETFTRLAFVGVQLPTFYRLYVLSRRNSTITYMVAMEMVLALTKAVVAFILAFVFATLLPYDAFWVAFGMAALLSIFYGFL